MGLVSAGACMELGISFIVQSKVCTHLQCMQLQQLA